LAALVVTDLEKKRHLWYGVEAHFKGQFSGGKWVGHGHVSGHWLLIGRYLITRRYNRHLGHRVLGAHCPEGALARSQSDLRDTVGQSAFRKNARVRLRKSSAVDLGVLDLEASQRSCIFHVQRLPIGASQPRAA